MTKTFLLSHLGNLLNVIRVMGFINIENFGSKKCNKWNICLFVYVCFIFLPCLIKPGEVAAMNVLPKSNGSSLMSTELFIKDIAMTSEACIQFRDGWKEGRLKRLSGNIESVSPLPFSVQETRREDTDKNNKNGDDEGIFHNFSIWVAVIVVLLIIFYDTFFYDIEQLIDELHICLKLDFLRLPFYYFLPLLSMNLLLLIRIFHIIA